MTELISQALMQRSFMWLLFSKGTVLFLCQTQKPTNKCTQGTNVTTVKTVLPSSHRDTLSWSLLKVYLNVFSVCVNVSEYKYNEKLLSSRNNGLLPQQISSSKQFWSIKLMWNAGANLSRHIHKNLLVMRKSTCTKKW